MKSSFINYNIFSITDADSIQTIGKNQKNLLIFLSEKEGTAQYIVEFLRKILAAIKFDLDNDALLALQTADAPISLSKLCIQSNAAAVIVFGYEPHQLGIFANMKKYAFFTIQDTHYLFCDHLELIESQTSLKAALWDALKRQFL